MAEQTVPFELLNYRSNTVMPTNPEIVTLRNIVRQNHSRPEANSAQHREQHVPLERLCLIDDHEGIVQ